MYSEQGKFPGFLVSVSTNIGHDCVGLSTGLSFQKALHSVYFDREGGSGACNLLDFLGKH